MQSTISSNRALDDPVLRKVCRADFVIGDKTLDRMFALMREKGGLGLAAPQVGIDARLFVTEWGEVFVNPARRGHCRPDPRD